jgi:hypothetical protein
MTSSLQRSLAFASITYIQARVDLIPPSCLQDLFQSLTKDQYDLLAEKEKDLIGRIYTDISKTSCWDHSDWVRASIKYQATCVAPLGEERVFETKNAFIEAFGLEPWEVSHPQLVNCLWRYYQSRDERYLDLRGFKIKEVPYCLLTEPLFSKVNILDNPIERLPDLLVGQIKNFQVYSDLEALTHSAKSSPVIERPSQKRENKDFLQLKKKLVDREEPLEDIAAFLLGRFQNIPNSHRYLGLILALAKTSTERNNLLGLLQPFNEKELLDILEGYFMYVPSFWTDDAKGLQSMILDAAKIEDRRVVNHLVHYYVCELSLLEGLTPSHKIGRAAFCALQHILALSCLFSLDQSRINTSSYCEILLSSLERILPEVPFVSTQDRCMMQDHLESIESKAPERIRSFLRQIGQIHISERRTASLGMYYNSMNYVQGKTSVFDQEAERIIGLAADKIRDCSNKKELGKCYEELFDLFGETRGLIAEADATPAAHYFGKLRTRSLKTPLEGAYKEYGAKILHFLEKSYMQWIDQHKLNIFDDLPIENLKQALRIEIPETYPTFVSAILVKYEENSLVARVLKKDSYMLGAYSMKIPTDQTLLSFRFPPFESVDTLKINHASFYRKPDLQTDIMNAFIEAALSSTSRLKGRLSRFAYLSAYAALFSRGSAAIAMWFMQAICRARDLQLTYGREEIRGGCIYRPTSDLDALSALFAEFEEDFLAKAVLSPIGQAVSPPYQPSIKQGNEESELIAKMIQIDQLEPMTCIQKEVFIAQKKALLYLAAELGYVQLFDLLIAKKDVFINAPLFDGRTPLHIASRRGKVDIVRRILRDPDVNVNCQKSEGETPLLEAAQKGYAEIVAEFLSHKDMNVDLAKEDGGTPFDMACLAGHIPVIEMLLIYKQPQEDERLSILAFAKKNCSLEVVSNIERIFASLEEK